MESNTVNKALTSFTATSKTSDDGDIASVMGFSGFGMCSPALLSENLNVKKYSLIKWQFELLQSYIEFYFYLPGKKARTFDLDAIFEQTRRTAIERSQRVIGKCFITGNVITLLSSHDEFNCIWNYCILRGAAEGDRDGGGRGELQVSQTVSPESERKSCFFQVGRHLWGFILNWLLHLFWLPVCLLKCTIRFALSDKAYLFIFIIFRLQKSDSSSDSGSDSDSDSELIGPPVPPQHAAQQGDDDDDEHVGPPLPPGYTGSTAHSDDDDDEEGEAQDDDDDVCLNYTIS